MKKRVIVLIVSLLLVLGIVSVAQADPPIPKKGTLVGIMRDNSHYH
jgi:hypothetical protein